MCVRVSYSTSIGPNLARAPRVAWHVDYTVTSPAPQNILSILNLRVLVHFSSGLCVVEKYLLRGQLVCLLLLPLFGREGFL